MQWNFTVRARQTREQVHAALTWAAEGGPFHISGPEQDGPGTWAFSIAPRRQDMAVSFTKVSEFQLRLARHVEIVSAVRADHESLAVAS